MIDAAFGIDLRQLLAFELDLRTQGRSEPDLQQLVNIAVALDLTPKHLLGVEPRVINKKSDEAGRIRGCIAAACAIMDEASWHSSKLCWSMAGEARCSTGGPVPAFDTTLLSSNVESFYCENPPPKNIRPIATLPRQDMRQVNVYAQVQT